MLESDFTPIGHAPVFLDLMDRVSALAPLHRPALVIGERGTGKELVAARLHYLSSRWDKAFHQINCAALAESLLESELFGHEAGAFTGANRARAGRFEAANGGTLFLDEIASMSMAAQEKLLRVIEYGSFQRLGGNEALKVDVRVVAAANVDLPQLAQGGKFRADLLDRLAFDVLTVPPLRRRREDIPELAHHFGRAMAAELGWDQFPGFSQRAADEMLAHAWPGNVRELKNLVERAVYQAATPDQPIDRLVFDPFASPYRPAATPVAATAQEAVPATGDLRAQVAAYEKQLVEDLLRGQRFNQRAAAAAAGLSYDQLRHMLKKHGL